MRAIVVRELGPPQALVLEERPAPAPGPGEVCIAAHAIGVNYPDLLVIRGLYQVRPPLPFVPGKEVAGIVTAVGPDVTSVRIGDRVLAEKEYGAYAEDVIAPERHCYPMPPGMGFTTAAAMGTVYLTAHFALFERGGWKPGEIVLVHGATGGVGHAAVQLARARGARVLAGVRNAAQAALARRDGAVDAVDLSAPDLRDALPERVRSLTGGHGADLILDPVGGDVFDASLRALAWRGRLVVIGFVSGRIPEVKANYLLVKNIAVVGLQWSDYRERLPEQVQRVQQEIFELYRAGRVAPRIVAEYPLERTAEALERLERGGVDGKLVLTTRHAAPPMPAPASPG